MLKRILITIPVIMNLIWLVQPPCARAADTYCYPVKDVNDTPGAGSDPMEFVYTNGTTFFTADDGSHGRELWQTNGTDRTTVMVGDINPGATGSSPKGLTAGGTRLFFSANDGVSGNELWSAFVTMTKVIPAGDAPPIVQLLYSPYLFQDINPGTGDSYPINLGIANNFLYFSADDGSKGAEPWRSDNTIDMATRAYSYWNINPNPQQGSKPSGFSSVPGYPYVFFSAYTPTGGNEVWYNTGSITGMCYPIEAGAGNPFNPGKLVPFNGGLVFPATSAATGRELWMCTPGITTTMVSLVSDINSGLPSSNPSDLINANGNVFFSATDGSSGCELYKLSMEPYVINKPGAVKPATGTPWKTLGGMTIILPVVSRLRDINPGAGDSNPAEFVAVSNGVYFQADDGVHGTELWYSNGGITGTWMVADIYPGAGSSNPSNLTYLDGQVYFAADDGVHGNELWRSDGTGAGTRMVRDIWPGKEGSNPENLTVAGTHIIFSANHPDLGLEPWITGPPLPSQVSPGQWVRYK